MNPIVLSNDSLHLEFAAETGALTGFRVARTGWTDQGTPVFETSYKDLAVTDPYGHSLRASASPPAARPW